MLTFCSSVLFIKVNILFILWNQFSTSTGLVVSKNFVAPNFLALSKFFSLLKLWDCIPWAEVTAATTVWVIMPTNSYSPGMSACACATGDDAGVIGRKPCTCSCNYEPSALLLRQKMRHKMMSYRVGHLYQLLLVHPDLGPYPRLAALHQVLISSAPSSHKMQLK